MHSFGSLPTSALPWTRSIEGLAHLYEHMGEQDFGPGKEHACAHHYSSVEVPSISSSGCTTSLAGRRNKIKPRPSLPLFQHARIYDGDASCLSCQLIGDLSIARSQTLSRQPTGFMQNTTSQPLSLACPNNFSASGSQLVPTWHTTAQPYSLLATDDVVNAARIEDRLVRSDELKPTSDAIGLICIKHNMALNQDQPSDRWDCGRGRLDFVQAM